MEVGSERPPGGQTGRPRHLTMATNSTTPDGKGVTNEDEQNQNQLTASGIYTNADVGEATFRLSPGELQETDIEVYPDRGETIFSVDSSGENCSAGLLLELTPEEATKLASELTQAAEEAD